MVYVVVWIEFCVLGNVDWGVGSLCLVVWNRMGGVDDYVWLLGYVVKVVGFFVGIRWYFF